MKKTMRTPFIGLFLALGVCSGAIGAEGERLPDAVSFHKDLKPILTANCNGCHKADKSKGGLDMTTYAALMKGGKHGAPVVPGDPKKSSLVEMISGPEPEMPEDGDPLKAEQVDLISRWIEQGAKDDTPTPGLGSAQTPVYHVPPVISSLAFSPDGSLLAINGYSEVLLYKADGTERLARLVGNAPRIESARFSADGKLLGVSGGAPGEYGAIQVWNVADRSLVKSFQISNDSLYGLSFAPDGKSVACGAADKVVRRVNLDDGKLLLEFKAHGDWVMGTTFTLDGKRLVSGSRDKALKLIDVESGRFVDDINNPLDAIICLARHPKEEQVLYGGDLGNARLYRISDNQNRTAGRNDTNRLREFPRQTGPVTAVAFSPDGARVAIGSIHDVNVYDKEDKPAAVLSGHGGPVFSIAWSPDGEVIATGGFDGQTRLFDAQSGNLLKQFVAVPIEPRN